MYDAMSKRRFTFTLAAIGLTTLLSATPFPGALMGFMFGIAVAFFVAGPTFLAVAALQKAGVPASDKSIVAVLALIYAALTVVAFIQAWRAWTLGALDRARLCMARGIFMVALPLIGLISVKQMAEAWPG